MYGLDFLGDVLRFGLDWLRWMPSFALMADFTRIGAYAWLVLALVACQSSPPRPWLRYELDGPTDWEQLGGGRFGGNLNGAEVVISLNDPDTRVWVAVENRSEDSLSVSVGPDAGGDDAPAGELLVRQIDGPAAGGPAMTSYTAMEPVALDEGWRATFFLDRPLGRHIKLGQYFVLAVEVEDAAGGKQRAHLPVVGKFGTVARQ